MKRPALIKILKTGNRGHFGNEAIQIFIIFLRIWLNCFQECVNKFLVLFLIALMYLIQYIYVAALATEHCDTKR